MSDRGKLILIDGNSILYRAFFALPLLSNQKGQYTNAVYGFTMMILKLLQDEAPTHIAVAFDAGKSTFRHESYADYKGTRAETPAELVGQFPLVREVLGAMRIHTVERENYEADDLIGTISLRAEQDGFAVRLVSGDKDLLQLVSPRVTALLTRKGITEMETYDVERVYVRYGLRPEQLIDLKGLTGDPSDNIPGVPGVGEKTAIKLLQEYGTLEAVLDHIGDISGKKLQERLREHAQQALLSKELARIHRHVPLEWEWDALACREADGDAVRALFRRLEFRSLLERLPTLDRSTRMEEMKPEADQPVDIHICESEDDFDEGLIHQNPTLGLMVAGGGVSIAGGCHAWFIPWDGGRPPDSVLRIVQDVSRDKTVFDLKQLIVLFSKQGVALGRQGWFDALLALYLLNPSDGYPDLEEILSEELRFTLPDRKSVRKETDSRKSAAHFALLAHGLVRLRPKLERALKERNLDSLYQDLELPLSFVLAKMELTGVRVDTEQLRRIGEELNAQIQRLTKEIYRLAGMEFNLHSPKQLGEVLFEKLGLPPLKKTKTGYSTNADVLEKLAPLHEVVEKILEFRQLAKLQSTYVEGLLKVVDPRTGKVHTSFNQAITATGRLSSTEPNLQNIPVRLEEGRRLRRAFIPSEEGWFILAADYSQIELRILAHISQDEALIEAFRNDLDIHTKTASDVFEVPLDAVTPAMRRQAKAVNFGIVYGISDYGLSQNLNIPRAQAAAFIQQYFQKFPGVKRYMEEIVKQAKANGYVTTLLQRRRYLPDIHSPNFNLRSFAERTAMNTPIQGTAADVIKLAMVNIAEAMEQRGLRSRMLLQVHDELVFEVPGEELETMQTLVRDKMEGAVSLSVPLKVDIHYGRNWYEAK